MAARDACFGRSPAGTRASRSCARAGEHRPRPASHVSNVAATVRVGLEGQAEEREAWLVRAAELEQSPRETDRLLVVDASDSGQQMGRRAHALRDLDRHRDLVGQARAAEAETGIEELVSD